MKHGDISRKSAEVWLQRLSECVDAAGQEAHSRKRKRPANIEPFPVEAAASMWKTILGIGVSADAHVSFAIDVPQGPKELASAIVSLVKWLSRFPSTFLVSADDGCMERSIARKIVMCMSASAPRGAMRALRWGDIAPVMELPHAMQIMPSDDTWGDLEDRFGIDPLMISFWCGGLSEVPTKFWHHFTNYSVRVRDEALAMQDESGGAPPTALMLAERLG